MRSGDDQPRRMIAAGIGIAVVLITALAAVVPARAAGTTIAIVAAENFYGDVARQIGGDHVVVTSILNNPDQDPHLFETSPSVAREIAAARVVVYNGAGYDPWMERLLTMTAKPGRVTIVAADLMHKTAGDNPHLWYDPATMPAVAKALAAALAAADPAHAAGFAARVQTFLASLAPLNSRIATLRDKYAGTPVTASEPVFGYMADALALKMHDRQFQLAVQNDTEPSAGDVAALERELQAHQVRVLFYNRQVTDRLVQHLVDIARAANVAVVGVTETCPSGLSFQQWMASELDRTAAALAGRSS